MDKRCKLQEFLLPGKSQVFSAGFHLETGLLPWKYAKKRSVANVDP